MFANAYICYEVFHINCFLIIKYKNHKQESWRLQTFPMALKATKRITPRKGIYSRCWFGSFWQTKVFSIESSSIIEPTIFTAYTPIFIFQTADLVVKTNRKIGMCWHKYFFHHIYQKANF